MKNLETQNIIEIVRYVGDEILLPNWGKVERSDKEDGSPVTVVDKQASDYIITNLQALTPDIPVISEEAAVEDNIGAMQSSLRWVTDPLDGTATYLNGPRLGDVAGFGVHVALIDGDTPVAGVAYFPAQGRMYFTDEHHDSYLQIKGQLPEQIYVNQMFDHDQIRVAVPWKEQKRPLSINGHDYNAVPAVGGEQICKVAHGEADLMWHDRPDKPGATADKEVFSHWDVAAAHAILKGAGGDLYDISTGRSVTYDNPEFTVPACVAGHSDLLDRIGFNRVERFYDNGIEFD